MEPPMLLVCLNRTSETRQAITEASWFAVNILSEGQADLANAFARKAPDKFRDTEVARGFGDLPLIPGALAQLVCRVSETATGGSHTVFLAEVTHAEASEGEPLTYYRGRFGRFHDTLQDEAYVRLRQLVIDRDLPRDKPLDVEQLARDLDVPAEHVFYGLTKLVTDGLVARRPDGRLVVKALDIRTAHEAIDARCAIQVAVVDSVAGRLTEAEIANLRAHAEAAQAGAIAVPPDIQQLVDHGHAFHERFVGLLGNDALLRFFARLEIHAIWRRASGILDNRLPTSADYLIELADALAVGDAERAKRTLYDHAAAVKDDARQVIEALGGKV
jgi:DNA-binding GntR family transcriptional regulator